MKRSRFTEEQITIDDRPELRRRPCPRVSDDRAFRGNERLSTLVTFGASRRIATRYGKTDPILILLPQPTSLASFLH
jgi:hypothetical protein